MCCEQAIAIASEFDYADNENETTGFSIIVFRVSFLLSFCLDIIYGRISLDGMIGVRVFVCECVFYWCSYVTMCVFGLV